MHVSFVNRCVTGANTSALQLYEKLNPKSLQYLCEMMLEGTQGHLKWCNLHFMLVMYGNDVAVCLAPFLRYYHLFMK